MRRAYSFAILLVFLPEAADSQTPALKPIEVALRNPGFEAGFDGWGGKDAKGRPDPWFNSGVCKSHAEIDKNVKKSGQASLHIVNSSTRAPNVYGRTFQEVKIEPSQRYRISLWAKAKDLGSKGAVTVIVDDAWKVRPIALDKGTYDWTLFSGEFSLPANEIALNILSEDAGEAWIDDIKLEKLPEDKSTVIELESPAIRLLKITVVSTQGKKEMLLKNGDRVDLVTETYWIPVLTCKERTIEKVVKEHQEDLDREYKEYADGKWKNLFSKKNSHVVISWSVQVENKALAHPLKAADVPAPQREMKVGGGPAV
jgi:hypothetical protein